MFMFFCLMNWKFKNVINSDDLDAETGYTIN